MSPFLTKGITSRRIRIYIGLFLVVILFTLATAAYVLAQFESALTLALKNRSLLAAHGFLAGITTPDQALDDTATQALVNRFDLARAQDIEINYILLEKSGSRISASNNPGNIERTSSEEHEALRRSLARNAPVFSMGYEDEDDDDPDEPDEPPEEAGGILPENRFSIPRSIRNRFLSLTIPLKIHGRDIGGLNMKFSLLDLDIRLLGIKVKIGLVLLVEVLIILAGLALIFRSMVRDREKLAQKETAKVKSELLALQAQINPHFLFNTLNNLAALIPTDPALAEKVTLDMSDLFRDVLGAGKLGWWPLQKEIQVIRHYLDIESVRLAERLTYTLSVPRAVNEVRIPCLIIQPLVENSIKHAVAPSLSGGHIRVEVRPGKDLEIEVTDRIKTPGTLIPPAPKGGKMGLANIRNRLTLIFKDKARVRFAPGPRGTRVTIIIRDYEASSHEKT